jgi:hypothetical protein
MRLKRPRLLSGSLQENLLIPVLEYKVLDGRDLFGPQLVHQHVNYDLAFISYFLNA